ncbi:hypothetical protein VTO42DRAFT_8352 [Malbranchea cinnamomea]
MPTDAVTSALYEWINSFPIGRTVKSSSDLSDGTVLWEILQDIDAQFFLGDLPESSSSDHWVPKWQNLKHIHKLLLNYLRDQNDGEIPAGLSTVPDLKAIAENSSTRETNQLLKLLLMAAISSPNAEAYITTMQSLSTPTQEGLKDIIQEAQNPTEDRLEQIRDEQDDYRARREVAVDPELQFEERVGKLLAENDKLSHEKKELEKALEDLHDRLARLQEHNDTLQDRLTSTEDRLATLKSGKGDLGPNAKVYESRTRQQEDIIASLEAKLSAAQEEIDNLQMSLESLRVKNERYQKLQDDYDEIKNERDQLVRKANAAEKYRQKLQASQDFEKENHALKKQVKDLQQQLKDLDSSQKFSSERDVELEEYRRVLPRIEQDRHEIQHLKKQLEFNNHALTERLQLAEEQHARDQATISELRDRIRELEGLESPSPGASTPKAQKDFQRDLDELGKGEVEISADNEDEKSEFGKENENESYKKLHEDYTTVRSKLAEAEGRLESLERQLTDAKNELGLVDKDKLEILNELKASSASELMKMRDDWDSLQQRVRELEGKLDVSKTLVRGIASERDALRSSFEKRQTKLQNEDQTTLAEMKRLLEEITADGATLSPAQLLSRFTEATERSAENFAKRAEHITKQNELIKTLQELIKTYEDATAEQEMVKASRERENELLQVVQRQAREIALISSAWYDFQSRLNNGGNSGATRYRGGSSHAGPDAQRTWLARQRALVGSVASRGGP